jgi:hypothetical protein
MLSQKLKEIRKIIKPTSEKIGPKLANGAGNGKAESTKEPLEGAYKRTT